MLNNTKNFLTFPFTYLFLSNVRYRCLFTIFFHNLGWQIFSWGSFMYKQINMFNKIYEIVMMNFEFIILQIKIMQILSFDLIFERLFSSNFFVKLLFWSSLPFYLHHHLHHHHYRLVYWSSPTFSSSSSTSLQISFLILPFLFNIISIIIITN